MGVKGAHLIGYDRSRLVPQLWCVIYPNLASITVLQVKIFWSNPHDHTLLIWASIWAWSLKRESPWFSMPKAKEIEFYINVWNWPRKFVRSHLVMLYNVAEQTLWQLCKLRYLCVFGLWVQSPLMVNCNYIFYLHNALRASFQFNLQQLRS